MPTYEGVNVSGEVAGFDFIIQDRVRSHSIDEANSEVTFLRSLSMADEYYKRQGSIPGILVATVEVPFKADGPEALDAAITTSRELPVDQTLRNTVLMAENLVGDEESQAINNIRLQLKRRVAGVVTQVLVGGVGSTLGVVGAVEGIREQSRVWGYLALAGGAGALAGFCNLSNGLRETIDGTPNEARNNLWDIHRRRHMVELAKHATEPVKPEQAGVKLG